MTIRSLITAVALVAVTPLPAAAQEPGAASTGLILGSRVRITTTGDRAPIKGLVVAVDPQTVTLATDAGVVKTPVSSISAADISLGKRRFTRRGIAIGAGLGLVIGLLAPVDESDTTTALWDESRGLSALYGLSMGTAYGALVGALIKTDRWSRVELSIASSPAPVGRPRIRIAGAIRF